MPVEFNTMIAIMVLNSTGIPKMKIPFHSLILYYHIINQASYRVFIHSASRRTMRLFSCGGK